jgi:heat shock protein HtpX
MSLVYDDLIRQNRRATRLLLAGAFVVLATLVWVILSLLVGPDVMLDPIAGLTITAIGAGIGLLLTFLSYRSGPSLALRASRARPVGRDEAPELHRLLDEVCVSAGIRARPTLHIVDDPAPNAFATGLRIEDSHIAVTTGLIDRLTRYELRAVLAHEVAHIINDDIRAVTIAVATAGLVALLADVLVRMTLYGGARGRPSRDRGSGGAQALVLVVGILAAVLAPLAAQVIRFAVSRQREYLADATAAQVLRDPQSMVDALRRLEQDDATLARFEVATAHLWFEEPNDTQGGTRAAGLARRFATHPSLAQRIERLARLNAGTVDPSRPLRPVPRPGATAGSEPPPPPPPPPSSGPIPGLPGGFPGHFPGGASGGHPGGSG